MQLFVILTLGLTIYGSSIAISNRSPSSPIPPYVYPSSPHIGPPHFQHLGYQYPPGYALPPQTNQYGQQQQHWEREEKNKMDQQSMGLGAPPSMSNGEEKQKKGKSWF